MGDKEVSKLVRAAGRMLLALGFNAREAGLHVRSLMKQSTRRETVNPEKEPFTLGRLNVVRHRAVFGMLILSCVGSDA